MNVTRWVIGGGYILLGLAVLTLHAEEVDPTLFHARVQFKFQPDQGQNLGSLFEVYDEAGRVVAGAGFQGVYNTYSRVERYRLNVFLAMPDTPYTMEPLPRVNSQSGVYLSDYGDTVWGHSKTVEDAHFYQYDLARSQWRVDPATSNYDVMIAGQRLHVESKRVRYGEHDVLDELESQARIGAHDYAAGHLFFHVNSSPASIESNRLMAIPWTPGRPRANVADAVVMPFQSEREFVYAYGQLHDQVVIITNTGGIYIYHASQWSVLREPDLKVSYQVYCILNFYDHLLLGHYPSGELIRYDGTRLEPLTGWPPVMPGVSTQAREAQSLALYGGSLFAGVWPWGELWRYDPSHKKWTLAQRMFQQPPPTDTFAHPFEAETKAVHDVYNIWGQRVTSLVPFGDSLLIATSSKGGQPRDAKFTFLTDEILEQYGRVFRWRQPGHVSAMIPWSDQSSTLDVRITRKRITLEQNGTWLASQEVDLSKIAASSFHRITWGRGMYGSSGVTILSRIVRPEDASIQPTTDVPASSKRREDAFRGAYVHVPPLVRVVDSPAMREAAIDTMLDGYHDHKLRVVLPYVNTSDGKTLFPSKIAAARVYGDDDPLQYLVHQARQRGLQVELVVCALVSGDTSPAGILTSHPDWAVRTMDGQPTGYLSSAHPDARAWLVALIAEVVQRYEPDGIWLDYLRYPNRQVQLDVDSAARLTAWQQQHPDIPSDTAERLFREQELTILLRDISRAVRADRPDRKLSIYSWGPHVTHEHAVCQPWHTWSREGLLDRVNISGYCYRQNYGEQFMDKFRERLAGARALNEQHGGLAEISFALGVNTSHGRIDDVSEIRNYEDAAHSVGVDGVAVFTWNSYRVLARSR